MLVREKPQARPSSKAFSCINQALEVLTVMDECLVARKIRLLVQELVDALLAPSMGRSEQQDGEGQVDPAQLDLFTQFGSDPADPMTDFAFDLTAFNFFDANFPILFDE
jgi:hypothetical protein